MDVWIYKIKKAITRIPWWWISYYGTIYLILIVAVAVLYTVITPIAKPVVALIFPLDPRNSLTKMLYLFTGFYWLAVGIKTWRIEKKKPPKVKTGKKVQQMLDAKLKERLKKEKESKESNKP